MSKLLRLLLKLAVSPNEYIQLADNLAVSPNEYIQQKLAWRITVLESNYKMWQCELRANSRTLICCCGVLPQRMQKLLACFSNWQSVQTNTYNRKLALTNHRAESNWCDNAWVACEFEQSIFCCKCFPLIMPTMRLFLGSQSKRIQPQRS
jgi:hypothetical protein